MAYADDLVLLCPSTKGLQCLLSTCQAYGKENDITYNCKQIICMSFFPKCLKLRNEIQIRLYDDVLTCVQKHTCKYLGFNINSDFSDDDDI